MVMDHPNAGHHHTLQQQLSAACGNRLGLCHPPPTLSPSALQLYAAAAAANMRVPPWTPFLQLNSIFGGDSASFLGRQRFMPSASAQTADLVHAACTPVGAQFSSSQLAASGWGKIAGGKTALPCNGASTTTVAAECLNKPPQVSMQHPQDAHPVDPRLQLRQLLPADVEDSNEGNHNCHQSKDLGFAGRQCRAGDRWYYNQADRTCKKMAYRGCGGNQNRYCSKAECERMCRR